MPSSFVKIVRQSRNNSKYPGKPSSQLDWGHSTGWGKQRTSRPARNITEIRDERAIVVINILLYIHGVLEAGRLVQGYTHAHERSERTLTIYLSLVEYEAGY